MYLSEVLLFSSPFFGVSLLASRLTAISTKYLVLLGFLGVHIASVVWFPTRLPLNLVYLPAIAFLFPLRGPWGGPLGTLLGLAILAPLYGLPPAGAGYSLLLFLVVALVAFWTRFFAVLLPHPVAIRLFIAVFCLEFLVFPDYGLPLFLILSSVLGIEFFRRSPDASVVDTLQWLILVALTLATYRF